MTDTDSPQEQRAWRKCNPRMGKSPDVVEFRDQLTVPGFASGVSLPGSGWAIA